MTPANITVTVGQELAMQDNGSGNYAPRFHFGWTVTRVTPSGKFEAWNGKQKPEVGYDYTRRYFNAQGYELQDGLNGKVKRYGAIARTNVAELRARVAAKERIHTAVGLINKISSNEFRVMHADYQSKDTLLAQLSLIDEAVAAARAAVEAI